MEDGSRSCLCRRLRARGAGRVGGEVCRVNRRPPSGGRSLAGNGVRFATPFFPQQTGAAASSARGSSAQHLGRRGTRGLSHVTLRRRYPGGTSAMKNRSPRATTRRLCTRVVWWRSSREARHQLPRSATHSSRLRSPTRTREAETGEARYGRGVTRKVLAKGFPPYQPLQLRNYVRNINHFVFQCTLKLIIPDLRGLCIRLSFQLLLLCLPSDSVWCVYQPQKESEHA